MTEGQIQTKLIDFLKKEGFFAVKLMQTSKPGIPDVLAIRDGKAFFIEVKRPGQKPRPLQEYRMNQIETYGVKCFVFSGDLEEFYDALLRADSC